MWVDDFVLFKALLVTNCRIETDKKQRRTKNSSTPNLDDRTSTSSLVALLAVSRQSPLHSAEFRTFSCSHMNLEESSPTRKPPAQMARRKGNQPGTESNLKASIDAVAGSNRAYAKSEHRTTPLPSGRISTDSDLKRSF